MDNDKGFSRQSKDIIEELEDYGWTFRLSASNHAIGRAPDGKTTCSIPKRLSLANRSKQNAEAALKAWRRVVDAAAAESGLKAVVEAIDAAPDYDPVIDGVLARGAKKHADETLALTAKGSESEPITEVSRRPWRARVGTSRSKSTTDQYESGAVVEVTYSNGTVRYECALPGCGWQDSDNPRSTAMHYSSHVRKGEVEPVTQPRVPVAKDVPIPPESIGHREGHAYTPTERLMNALAGWLSEQSWDNTDDLARLALTWFHDRPDLPDPEARLSAPLTSDDIIARIRLLVGGRDLALEAAHEELLRVAQERMERIVALERDVERLTEVLATLGEMAQGEARRA